MGRVVVLGSCGAYPEPGRACSGFAVEWEGYRLVLDLGYGTLPRLLARWPDGVVDGVVITQEHPDHCVDLHGLFRMKFYGTGGPRVPLYCPSGVLDRLAGLEPDVDLTAVFDVHPLPGSHELGPFTVTGVPLAHSVPNAGVRVQAGEVALAYTGDTAPGPGLVGLGRGADLFIVEATDRPGADQRSERCLMTAGESGYWARQAGARRLVLTHFWPGNDRDRSAAAARETFGADVVAAEEGCVLTVGGS